MLVQVKHIGLVNIVAGKKIVPEFIQHRATADNLAHALIDIVDDKDRIAIMKEELARVRELLGSQGASGTVAEHIMASG
jgi:lipid-A-disaccharide synthase